MGFETNRAEVVAGRKADISVERGRQVAEQGDGWLGATFFDALPRVSGGLAPRYLAVLALADAFHQLG